MTGTSKRTDLLLRPSQQANNELCNRPQNGCDRLPDCPVRSSWVMSTSVIYRRLIGIDVVQHIAMKDVAFRAGPIRGQHLNAIWRPFAVIHWAPFALYNVYFLLVWPLVFATFCYIFLLATGSYFDCVFVCLCLLCRCLCCVCYYLFCSCVLVLMLLLYTRTQYMTYLRVFLLTFL